MPFARPTLFCVAALAVGIAAAPLQAAPSKSTSVATASRASDPVDLGAPVQITPSEVQSLASGADGSIRFAQRGDNGRDQPTAVQTVTAANALIPPITLLAASPDHEEGRAVLTGEDSTVVYNATDESSDNVDKRQWIARTYDAAGAMREQPLAPPGGIQQVYDVSSGAGSIAVQAGRPTGPKRFEQVLAYRAAGETSFTAPVVIGRGSSHSFQFGFAPDGSGVVATTSQYVEPMTFRRISRDGRVGPGIRFGKIGREAFASAFAFTPTGDLVAAILEPPSRSSQRLGLYVATLRVGASRFTTPKRIDLIGGYTSEDGLDLATTADGRVTLIATTDRQVRFYEGLPDGLQRTSTITAQTAFDGTVLATADGGAAALWSAVTGTTKRKSTRTLMVSQRLPGGPWTAPKAVASGAAPGDATGVRLMQAVALPGRGVAVAYATDGKRGGSFVQRLLP